MDTTDAVMDLAKRRGFLFPSFEVYGGLAGFYDFGPLGAVMKTRFEDLWRRSFHATAVPMAEVACPQVTMHEVLKASGHVDEFTDLVTKCANDHPHRADHLIEAAGFDGNADALSAQAIDEQVGALRPKCPVCGSQDWSPAAPQNLMFSTEIGPGSGRVGYLRPETAQGIFTDFPHLLRHFRGKLPFGGLQVGGSNRNEISPRQGMIRLREFHMVEAEVFFADTAEPGEELLEAFRAIGDRTTTFVPAKTGEPVSLTYAQAVEQGVVKNEALAYFLAVTQEFLQKAGLDPERTRFRQHLADEMAHYARDCWDAEFHSDRYGWVECVGIADRGCYDLTQHVEATGRASDFQVTVDFDRPFEVQAVQRVPVMGVLGKEFRQDAKAVAAALESGFQGDLESTLQETDGFDASWLDDDLVLHGPPEAQPAKVPFTVAFEDGRDIEVPPDGYQVRTGTWKVTGRKVVPRVIEPSFGVDRILYALWEHAYEKTEKKGEPYTVLRLSPHVAPVQVAVLPLATKDGLPERAKALERTLRAAGFLTDYDASGNIGRRYARQDEIGTPVCVTLDEQTPDDGAVTVRDRDTTEQERVPIDALEAHLAARLSSTTLASKTVTA